MSLITFFFGQESDIWGYAFTPSNDTAGRKALSDTMMKYMSNFARSGNPNLGPIKKLPRWEMWSNEAGAAKTILLNADADRALLSMSSEEVSIAAEQGKLAYEISTWNPIQRAYYGGVPWAFQWQTAE